MNTTPRVSLLEQQNNSSSFLFRPSDYSNVVAIQFMNSTLHVHKHLLARFTSLPSASDGSVQLKTISNAAGHVIVHYLYTGTYQCPSFDTDGLTPEDKNDAILRIGLEVYAATRKHGLEPLCNLAQAEIEATSKLLVPARTLQILKEIIPRPGRDDMWLQEYSRSLLKSTYPDLVSLLKSELMALENSEATMSMTEMFLRLMVDTAENEKVKNLQPVAREVENVKPVAAAPTLQELLDERNQLLNKRMMHGKLKGRSKLRLIQIEAMQEVQEALALLAVEAGADSPVLVEH